VDEERPSATAEGAALLRAAHRLFDRPIVLDDPIAAKLLSPERRDALRGGLAPFDDPERRRLRAGIAARSRYAEDCLAEAVARGVHQYVVLGAGLDSFAYRNPFPPDVLRVYEVDHPNTQRWKRERLADAGIAPPDGLEFVPVDFERETIADALGRSHLDPGAPAFVSWLGVTVYLGHDAIMRTLAWVASLARGSEIVFTYLAVPASRDVRRRSAVAARAASLGEPWRTFLEPATLARELGALGLTVVEDLASPDVAARYFRDRADGLRPDGPGRFMRARAGAPPA